MSSHLKTLLFILTCYFVISCDQDNQINNEIQLNEVILTGFVQKGPFITGSSIIAQELTDHLIPNGRAFEFGISDDIGSYNLFAELSSDYIELQATGFYFNEVQGQIEDERLVLTAIADVSSSTQININILTTLVTGRIKKLIENGAAFQEAESQAKQEVLSEFGLTPIEQSFSRLNIADPEEVNGVLLAMSIALQGTLNATELSEFISRLKVDLSTDGILDQENKRLIQESAYEMNYRSAVIRNNLEERYNDLGHAGTIFPETGNYLAQIAGESLSNTYLVHEVPTFLDRSSAIKSVMHYHEETKKLLIFDFDKNQIIYFDPIENTYSSENMAPWEQLPLGAADVGPYANVTYLAGNRFYISDFYLDLNMNEWVEIRDPDNLETRPWFGSIPLHEYQFASESLVYGVRKDYDAVRGVTLGFYSYDVDTKAIKYLNTLEQIGSASIESYEFKTNPPIFYGLEFGKMLFSVPSRGDLETYYIELNVVDGSLAIVEKSGGYLGRTSMRDRAAISHNTNKQEVIIYGGNANGYTYSHSDLWGFQYENQEWVQYRNAGIEQLSAGVSFSYAFVPEVNALFIFGGWSAGFIGERILRADFQ